MPKLRAAKNKGFTVICQTEVQNKDKLLCTDINSQMYEVEMEDFCRDISNDVIPFST